MNMEKGVLRKQIKLSKESLYIPLASEDDKLELTLDPTLY